MKESLSNIDFIKHIYDETKYCLSEMNDLSFDKLMESPRLQRALVKSLEIIGEASKNIHPDFKSKYPLLEWSEMGKMRDRLTHHYFGIDYTIVWETLENEIPPLKEWMEIILKLEDPE